MPETSSWKLVISRSKEPQSDNDLSFVGGFPRLPQGSPLPTCRLCGDLLSFFFQVAFPSPHAWAGKSMALFACTSCADEYLSIPRVLPKVLVGADIPDGFLEEYQENFRLLTFDTGSAVLRKDYRPRVKFKRWRLVPVESWTARTTRIGSEPRWKSRPEWPGAYEGDSMAFLMQLRSGIEYEIHEDAPPQATVAYIPSDPTVRSECNYVLFLGHALFFFGDASRKENIYVLPQVG